MNSTLKKIGITLTFIILLPALFFSIYEINSLSENEKMVESIYSNQLDAILYSINQFTEDVSSNWASKINVIANELSQIPAEKRIEVLKKYFAEYNSVNAIFFSDIKGDCFDLFPADEHSLIYSEKEIKTALQNNEEVVKKLFTYKRGGYRKIQSLESLSQTGNTILLFILDDGKLDCNLCGIVIESEKFINTILASKLRAIAQNDFAIIISNSSNNNIVYTTDPEVNKEELVKNDLVQKSLWFLPRYSAGIILKGGTIKDLVKERSNTNMWLISLLVVTLIMGVVFVFINIRKEIQLAQIKSDFVSNVSHELRTPLALITMFSETLEMGRVRTEEKKQEYYSIISQEANRLSKIVNKILNFSKMEAGKFKYNFADTDLNSIVKDIFNTYKFHLQNNGFNFSLNLYNDDLPIIKADCEAVSEAVVNLLDNAVKYSKDTKEIEISSGLVDNFIFVEIKDQGIGISKEHQDKIFDKFFRITSGLVHDTKGTGLGLTIVKHIMDAHGGSVSVTSSPGKGSSFRLNFNNKK